MGMMDVPTQIGASSTDDQYNPVWVILTNTTLIHIVEDTEVHKNTWINLIYNNQSEYKREPDDAPQLDPRHGDHVKMAWFDCIDSGCASHIAEKLLYGLMPTRKNRTEGSRKYSEPENNKQFPSALFPAQLPGGSKWRYVSPAYEDDDRTCIELSIVPHSNIQCMLGKIKDYHDCYHSMCDIHAQGKVDEFHRLRYVRD